MQWTPAQRETIETRNRNILVSAAAGSGKTAVLIQRIKSLVIEEKTDIDRFLITTFTNAAAAEMRERLEKAIREEMQKESADRQFLKKQLSLIPRANISTFHAFALEIIRRYFYLTDLEPGFRLGDDTEVSIMKKEAADVLFEERFEKDYEDFKEFLKKYSSDRSEKRIKENIISIYDEMRSIPDYMLWAQSRSELLKKESPCAALGLSDFVVEEAAEGLKASSRLYGAAAEILEAAGLEILYSKAIQDWELLDSFANSLPEQAGQPDIMDKCKSFLSSLKFNQMRATKEEKEDYAAIKDQVSALRKKGKKILDDLEKKYFSRELQQYDCELRELYDDTRYMTELIREFEIIFRDKKAEKNIVDFDDVMHYAIGILKDPVAAAEYREKFIYIFIDEFQDSNMLQETVIKNLAREDNVFMVGDVKQSIYKFRLAEPDIFKRKYALYASDDCENSVKIDLNRNFRSKRHVTETVNTVFSSIMDDYDDNSRLVCTIDDKHPGLDTQLHIMDMSQDDGGAFRDSKPEEQLVLKLIKDNIGREIYDVKKGVVRKTDYRDIVVLSRSRASIGALERFLNNEGVPSYGENTGGYFETVEIQVFVNLLKIIDNTRQDIPLISVMRCPIFDFDVKELAGIRIAYRDGSFYSAVKSYSLEGRDERLKKRIQDMLDRIDYWKALKNTVTLEELIRVLLYETGYFDYCSGLPVGGQRISNLRLLVEKAGQFEQHNYSGLHGFVAYIEAMKQSNISIGEAKTMGENENVVRIMTVHKSKGLEFPIVILTGMGRTIKPKGIGSSAAIHKDLALGMPYVNTKEKWHRKTLLQRVIEGKKAREEYEEEIRILYVAMTRAMDMLLLTGTVKDAERLEGITGKGRSFLEMVYSPMKEAGENISIYSDFAPDLRAGDNAASRIRLSEILEKSREPGDERIYRLIDKRLSYRYPFEKQAAVKSKYSVTELSRESTPTEKAPPAAVFLRPEFSIKMKAPDAARLGTMMHLVMEKTEFGKALKLGREYILQVLDSLTEQGLVSLEESRYINIDKILAFFESPIGIRAAKAAELYKEREFIMEQSVRGEAVIVQGIIDCYFKEEDYLVLIDYKNSRICGEADEEAAFKRYSGQIDIYAEALEDSCGLKVKESYLYLFDSGKFLPVKIKK